MRRIGIGMIMAMVLVCCNQIADDDLPLNMEEERMGLKAMVIAGDMVYVSPSGDATGVVDADNIEAALLYVRSSGGVVFLTDGDDLTIDHYYTSRNIVVPEFEGTLCGEGKNKSIIHAGRQSEEIGFKGAISAWWSLTSGNPYLATVLQFDNATGDVVLKNFSILIEDEQPTDVMPDYYGNPSTYISTFIEVLGGEHDTYVENVCLKGLKTTEFGNIAGMNVSWGIHVMLGSPVEDVNEVGRFFLKNVEAENLGDAACLFMRFASGSVISVDKLQAINVGQGITGMNVLDSQTTVKNTHVKIHSAGLPGMFFFNIPSGLNVIDNTIKTPWYWGIFLHNQVNHAGIENNTFQDLTQNFCYGGILVLGENNFIQHNDFKNSLLEGWSLGGGAVYLTGGSSGNMIHEMKFPKLSAIKLCEMIMDMTDNSETPEYDGANEIHNYVACENANRRDLILAEKQMVSAAARRQMK